MSPRFIFRSLLSLSIGVLAITGTTALATERAAVKTEAIVYAEPAARSATVVHLPAGAAVDVIVEIATSEGSWCQVRSTAAPNLRGYVRCSTLQREAKPLSKFSAPPAAENQLAQGDEITSLRCDEVNIFSWLRRYQFTEEQMEQLSAVAETTGYLECGRQAEPFKQAYYPNISLHQKMQSLRDWANIDPGDRCVESLRRFWSAARALMTAEQSARMQADLPKLAALLDKVRANPAKCLPVYCLY